MVGDQQAALLGQGCVEKGEAKNTYGTGCFLLYNTGPDIVQSQHGLLTTVAYQQDGRPPSYALEGSVAVAGLALRWLRDNMGIIRDYSEAFQLASEVTRTDGVYFVPAFSGLFAPHWRSDARGTLCGLTGHTTKQHVSRAVIESVCFQVCEIFEAMKADSGSEPSKILVDGGMTQSSLLLQLQSNLLGIEVHKPSIKEVFHSLAPPSVPSSFSPRSRPWELLWPLVSLRGSGASVARWRTSPSTGRRWMTWRERGR